MPLALSTYFPYAISKADTNFKYYLFIVIICSCRSNCCAYDNWCCTFHVSYHLYQLNFLFQISIVVLVYYLINLLFFGVLLLHYYINLRSPGIFCLFSGDIYLSLVISLSNPIFFVLFSTVLELLCGEDLETFVILSAVLLPIKSPVVSIVFLFELLFLNQF